MEYFKPFTDTNPITGYPIAECTNSHSFDNYDPTCSVTTHRIVNGNVLPVSYYESTTK